jgi:ElaB/YqjD/DUF883 family membrane-anchored ribosome-binding protein
MSSSAKQTVIRLKDFKGLNSLAGQFADRLQHWTSQAKTTARTTNGFVHANPWRTVGAVALVGIAAGVLMGRQSRGRTVKRAMGRANTAASELAGG